MIVLSGSSAHAFQHLLDMRNRRLRQNAVAEIEDKGAAGKRLACLVHRPIKRSTAGEKRQRIEIALHRYPALDLVARETAVDHPVEADGIERHLVDIAQEVGPGS